MVKLFEPAFHPDRISKVGSRIYAIIRRHGMSSLPYLVQKFIRIRRDQRRYKEWIQRYDIRSNSERDKAFDRINKPEFKRVLVSILLPVYNVPEQWLCEAIESVRKQWYPFWELCIADDCSTEPHVRRVLENAVKSDPQRIKIVYREKNGHISECSNSALSLVRGAYIALMDHDDVLPVHALYRVAEEINAHPQADLIYTDEDKIDGVGTRFDPHFKCDWNEDLFYGMNLLGHLCVFRAEILHAIGGFRKRFEGSQDYDLILRAMEQIGVSTKGLEDVKNIDLRVRHIPKILYHWRAIPGSVALNSEQKNYAHEAARHAIRDHFKRINKNDVKITEGYYPLHRVHFPLPDPPPLVSVIICAKDGLPFLKKAVEGVLSKTDYPRLELIIVDYKSRKRITIQYLNALRADARVRVLSYEGPFNFSDMNNRAACKARGDVLLFLNADIAMKHDQRGWLREMVSHALRPEVGPVGCKLIFPNGRIQHGGILLGVGGVAEHAHRGVYRKLSGYFGRAVCTQQFLAVTAACLALRRIVFEELGGFDAVNLPVAYSDVDLCLRARERGYRTIWTPFAELYHHESALRGPDIGNHMDSKTDEAKRTRLERESKYIRDKWATFITRDPFYNPNLDISTGNFSILI